MGRIPVLLLFMVLLNSSKASSQLNLRRSIDTIDKKIYLKVLPRNFYSQHMGFFCKKEVQVQQYTRLPLFFRLGSLEYVDRMERKSKNEVGHKNED
jgi:hypothetical protein